MRSLAGCSRPIATGTFVLLLELVIDDSVYAGLIEVEFRGGRKHYDPTALCSYSKTRVELVTATCPPSRRACHEVLLHGLERGCHL